MNNREALIQAVRGGSPEGSAPRIYDLRKYGGRDLIISGTPLSEETLRLKAEENLNRWRGNLLDMVLRGHLSLLENDQQVSPDDWRSIREQVPVEVRERFDIRFRTEEVG